MDPVGLFSEAPQTKYRRSIPMNVRLCLFSEDFTIFFDKIV